MAAAKNSGDQPEAGTSWKLGVINLNVHFFPSGEKVLCFAYNGGEELEGSLTPGYCEPCDFPSVGKYSHLF